MSKIKMPSSADIDRAYKDAIPRVPEAYKRGIDGTEGFVEAAVGGQKNYVQRMQDPSVLAKREAELKKLSDADWKNPATVKGAARIGQGMSEGAADRARNYEPIRAGLDGMTLPDKTTDAMVNIDNRVKPVVKKMQELSGKK